MQEIGRERARELKSTERGRWNIFRWNWNQHRAVETLHCRSSWDKTLSYGGPSKVPYHQTKLFRTGVPPMFRYGIFVKYNRPSESLSAWMFSLLCFLTLLWDILWISQRPPPFKCCYWGSHIQRGVLSLSSKTLQKISTSRVFWAIWWTMSIWIDKHRTWIW